MVSQWPGKPVDPLGNDFAKPTRALLEDLNLLETEADKKTGTKVFETPWSLQVITAGSADATKVVSTIVATLGGGAAIWAAIKGFWLTSPENQRLAYVGAAALIVSVVALALALIVRSDVQARATATAATYAARARIVAAFLRTTQPTDGQRHFVKRQGTAGWFEVRSFDWDKHGGLTVVIDGDRVHASELEGFTSLQVNPGP